MAFGIDVFTFINELRKKSQYDNLYFFNTTHFLSSFFVTFLLSIAFKPLNEVVLQHLLTVTLVL